MSKKHLQAVREHWNLDSAPYQKRHKISTDYVHYGDRCPTEDDLKLLGKIKGKCIIELGCGGGQNSIALAKRGAFCTGIDLSDEQLRFARKLAKRNHVNVKFLRGDVQDLRMIKSKSQDIAISMIAFDWVQSLDRAFKEAHRILKDRSLFVFSMQHPFFNCLGEEPKELMIKKSYFKRRVMFKERTGISVHYFIPTVSDIFNSLLGAGFTVERIIEPAPVKEYSTYADCYPLAAVKNIPSTIIFKAIRTSK